MGGVPARPDRVPPHQEGHGLLAQGGPRRGQHPGGERPRQESPLGAGLLERRVRHVHRWGVHELGLMRPL
eukprot:13474549-Alexandrium_andersonii.AAC.1